ncbi:E3 ubiquitin-protein ligase TRIM39-like, partial [Lithobates pipiens]
SAITNTEDGDEEDKIRRDQVLRDGRELDMVGISRLLYTELSAIIKWVYGGIYIPEPTDILLNADTAHNYLYISDDKKTAHMMNRNLNRPNTPERFQVYQVESSSCYDHNLCRRIPECTDVISPQVMSSQSFSSGRHYWDVDVGGSSHWRVGMCYLSMERTGEASEVGSNEKSWCLERTRDTFLLKQNMHAFYIVENLPIHRVRVRLDYKAGLADKKIQQP